MDLTDLIPGLARLVSAHGAQEVYRHTPSHGDQYALRCACGWESEWGQAGADVEAHTFHLERLLHPYLESVEVRGEGRAVVEWEHSATYPTPLRHNKHWGTGPDAGFFIKCEGCDFQAHGAVPPERDFIEHLPACPTWQAREARRAAGSKG